MDKCVIKFFPGAVSERELVMSADMPAGRYGRPRSGGPLFDSATSQMIQLRGSVSIDLLTASIYCGFVGL